MLGNAIALIAVAAMLGVEAYKASDRIPRIVLTVLAVVFALSGALIQRITAASPQIGAFITDVFSAPSSWFVLVMGLFFVLRRFWHGPNDRLASLPELDHSQADDFEARLNRFEEVCGLQDATRKTLTDIPKTTEYLRNMIVSQGTYQNEAIKEQERHIDRTYEAVDEKLRAIETRMLEKIENVSELVSNSLIALNHRERLSREAKEIELGANQLAESVTAGLAFTEPVWREWQDHERGWRRLIGDWCYFAEFYVPGARAIIYLTKQGRYIGPVSDKAAMEFSLGTGGWHPQRDSPARTTWQ